MECKHVIVLFSTWLQEHCPNPVNPFYITNDKTQLWFSMDCSLSYISHGCFVYIWMYIIYLCCLFTFWCLLSVLEHSLLSKLIQSCLICHLYESAVKCKVLYMLMRYTFQPHDRASIDQVVSGVTPQTTLRHHLIWLTVTGQALFLAGRPHHTYDVCYVTKINSKQSPHLWDMFSHFFSLQDYMI